MKAAQINKYGGVSEVKIHDIPRPVVKAGQVLVEVHASSLNPADTGVREGASKDMITMQLPATLGGDIAGVVKAVGEGVAPFQVGDKVYGQAYTFFGDSGALAEYAAVAAEHIAKTPRTIDMYQAGSLPLVGISAVQAIEDHVKLRAGQKILIHGGAGSVGAFSIQLAKHIGAYVATTVSAGDADFVKSLGADKIIDYKAEDFAVALRDYDAVVDLVADPDSAKGGGVFERSLSVLKPGGTLVSLVAYFGQDAIEAAQKRGFKAIYQLTKVTTAALNRLAQLVDEGVLTPRIGATYNLQEIQTAFTARERGKSGKVVIKIK